MKKRPLIILTGPTAVGKTAASIGLAKAVGGEIISADSMQVYRQMDIGSAKITKDEMQGIPHYLVDVLDPEEAFNVVRFQELAKEAMEEIFRNGHIPIVVGGTGFYIQALLYDIDFTENDSDLSFREELEKKAGEEGAESLHALLEKADPQAAAQIHPHNVKRVIRALEFNRKTGQKISEHNEKERQKESPISLHNQTEREKESPYNFAYFVLTDDRKALYERIDRRVDKMMEQGLLEEVRRLKDRGLPRDSVSMQGLGYKELFAYLEGEYPLEEAVRIIKRDTRHFAKRQLTWFRRERDVVWIDRQENEQDERKILESMLSVLREKQIIPEE